MAQIVQNFPSFYGTRRFMTLFIIIRHWCLSSFAWSYSATSHPNSSRSVLILSLYSKSSLHYGFSHRNSCTNFSSPHCVPHAAHISTSVISLSCRTWHLPGVYTECPRRNVQYFRRVFLMLNYTDITQNTYIQSWTVTEIIAREVWNFDRCYTLIDYQIHIETGRNMWFL